MPRPKRIFTAEEDKLIIDYFPHMATSYLLNFIKASNWSIIRRANELGIGKLITKPAANIRSKMMVDRGIECYKDIRMRRQIRILEIREGQETVQAARAKVFYN